jgi:hypothetical protein
MDKRQINYSRGEERWNAALTDSDVRLIHEAVKERERLRAQARRLSNAALAEYFGVHLRTVEKVVQHESWVHVR